VNGLLRAAMIDTRRWKAREKTAR